MTLTLDTLLATAALLKQTPRIACGFVVQPGLSRRIMADVMPAGYSSAPYSGLFGIALCEKAQSASCIAFYDRKLLRRYLAGHVTEQCLLLCWSRLGRLKNQSPNRPHYDH